MIVPARQSPHDLRSIIGTAELVEKIGKPLVFVEVEWRAVAQSVAMSVGVAKKATLSESAAITSAVAPPRSNTATITGPGGYTETSPGDESAVDTDTQSASADLGLDHGSRA